GITQLIKEFLAEPMPKGINWPQTLGSSLLALILIQIVTGILLSLYYSPNAQVAYESVQYIEKQVVFGALIRGVHYFAASAMIVLIFLHMARTFFYGAYKRPRQWTWVFGVFLLLLVLGFAFTGYLLPWDMKAYFATKVGINIGGITPVIGSYLVKILQGGNELGTITLSRFFSLHVIVLPLLLIFAAALHLFYIRLFGPTPPGLREGEPVEHTNRFFPLQLYRDSLVVFIVIGLVFFLAAQFGAPLEEKADPNDTLYVPRPDWYFYALFQLLKIFQGKLEVVGAIILPGAFFTLMMLLPFIDKNPERRLSQRPLAAGAGSASVFLIMALTAWGAYEGAKAKQLMAARRDVVSVEGEIIEPFALDPRAGQMLFKELKCGECHDQTSQGDNLPPGLEFSGNKYQQVWLINYLKAPHRIRWQEKDKRPVIRMPNFELSDREATNLSAFLLNKRQPDKFPRPEFDWAEADSEMAVSGSEIFFEYGCFGCHRIADEGQNRGPDLSTVGSKLLESYMFQLIKAPEKIVPGTPMKNFQLEDEEVEDIVAYLRGLK
ncbi:MAG: cytochrome b N-terminal domain-containing protein, partial [bacterium]